MTNSTPSMREKALALYDQLKKIQEPKGYFFNNDKEFTLEVLEQLLVNREHYGYMSCPCRLSANNREHDKDIICPCAYRAEDVAEYGSCFCGLYVSKSWNDGLLEKQYVPERRPLEKILPI